MISKETVENSGLTYACSNDNSGYVAVDSSSVKVGKVKSFFICQSKWVRSCPLISLTLEFIKTKLFSNEFSTFNC